MVFSSITFIFYILPIFFIIDFSLSYKNDNKLRNYGLIFISLIFYSWGEGKNVFLLIAIAIINFIIAPIIEKNKNKIYLLLTIALNLSVLIYYKYLYWLISFIYPFETFSNVPDIIMPLGISFFIFHAISYVIDVYRQDIRAARSLADFLAYFCMFPHLVAGPIVRYSQIEQDIAHRRANWTLFNFGVYRFLIGLNKKVIIANSVAVVADAAFAQNTLIPGLSIIDAWIGILAYGVQIYFDFSGYSDMAIDLAAMAGFKFEENFKRPYCAETIKEFWRRWHIALSSWFRDYLYIPLGGNKKGKLISYRNMIIVFLLCGLWHGANLIFIIWGLWHGCFLIIERFKIVGTILTKLPVSVRRLYATLVVLLGWVFFRADNLADAGRYISTMFSGNFLEVTLLYHSFGCFVLLFAIVICALPDRFFDLSTSHNPGKIRTTSFVLQMIVSSLSIIILLAGSRNPFIYFNF